MKQRIIAITAILCLLLAGCGNKSAKSTLTFYYPRENYTQNAEDSVLMPEQRHDVTYKSYFNILSVYLEGPVDVLLEDPFPEKLELVDVFTQGNTVIILLNDHLAKLNGTQLSITCCALAKTAMELTGTDSCRISCRNASLDGKRSILLTRESILLIDEIPVETIPNPEV